CFPGKAFPADDPEGRRTVISQVLDHVNRQHGRVDHLVRDIQAIVVGLKNFISEQDILRLPDPDHCQVIEMPEFQRGNYSGYLNPAPPLDPRAASIYAISPPPSDWDARRVDSYLEEYNRHALRIISIHEGYPGHYVQLDYS